MTKKATAEKKTTRKKKSSQEEIGEIQQLDLISGEYFTVKDEPEVNMDDYKIKKMGPFDLLDMMFTHPEKFDALPDDQLEQFAFLLNRRFAIKYPMQAAQFSKMGINLAWPLRSWALFVRRVEGTGRVPRFLYTSAGKKEKSKVGIDAFEEDVLVDYMKRYNLSRKDFKDMLQFFNDETVAHVEQYFKLNSKSEQKKMFKTGKSAADI